MEKIIKIFKALSNETRLNIILLLMGGDMCACKIPKLVKKAQPAVSKHLKILDKAGITSHKKDGKKRIYTIKNKKVLRIIDIFMGE